MGQTFEFRRYVANCLLHQFCTFVPYIHSPYQYFRCRVAAPAHNVRQTLGYNISATLAFSVTGVSQISDSHYFISGVSGQSSIWHGS